MTEMMSAKLVAVNGKPPDWSVWENDPLSRFENASPEFKHAMKAALAQPGKWKRVCAGWYVAVYGKELFDLFHETDPQSRHCGEWVLQYEPLLWSGNTVVEWYPSKQAAQDDLCW